MNFDDPFFSFTYGGQSSSELLPKWNRKRSSRELDPARTEQLIVWVDPTTGVEVRCVGVEYREFEAVEWTLYLKNNGNKDAPILTDIKSLDLNFTREQGDEFVLHGTSGDFCTAESFQPFEMTLESGTTKRFAPVGGRPTNGAFPYYNLQKPGGGVFIAIGWPGQWFSSFTRDAHQNLHVEAGQETIRLSLKPGEMIRSPLIALLFWHGTDTVVAQNLWRRWMMAHNLPRTADGKLPPTQIVACSSHQFSEMTKADEESQKLFIDRYLEEGMKLDYWWMDAGWYPCEGDWPKTGIWKPDPVRFPHGLRAVSDHAHAKDVKTIVWFEPERIGHPQAWARVNHPEWLLEENPASPGQANSPPSLFNLGNREARTWLTDHVSRLIDEEGIDLYRQDFNVDPLPFWQAADSADRQGMVENLYVQGYLAYWDALRQRYPQLRIDSCAAGGRRDDLETLRRAVPLIRSDYMFEPTSQQNHHYSFASWIPYHGAGYVAGKSTIGTPGLQNQPGIEVYGFRSNMSPSLILCYDVRSKDLDYRLAQSLFDQLKRIGPNYLGDFYPLTSYNLANNVWMAWQYHRPETGEGCVQAFRRLAADSEKQNFQLRGLESAAKYRVTDLDSPDGAQTLSGGELMQAGLLIHLPKQPDARVITYQRME